MLLVSFVELGERGAVRLRRSRQKRSAASKSAPPSPAPIPAPRAVRFTPGLYLRDGRCLSSRRRTRRKDAGR